MLSVHNLIYVYGDFYMQNDVDKHSQTILNLTISPQNSDRVRSQMREAFFLLDCKSESPILGVKKRT